MINNTTVYYENQYINAVTRNDNFAVSGIWIGLFDSIQTDTNTTNEVVSGNYARAFATNAWPTMTGQTVSNTSLISFPDPSASWGTVKGWAIFDSAVGGNRYLYGSLKVGMPINASNSGVYFDINDFQIGRTTSADLKVI